MNFNEGQIQEYLNDVKARFQYYKDLGERAFSQLNESQLNWQPDKDANSIAIIVNHLHGNMLSRWTDFMISDGEKEWRERDSEFEDGIKSRDDLMTKWEEGWNCLFDALDQVSVDNFHHTILIRSESHSITQALNRQLAHYAYHIGQIVWIGRMLKGQDWKSLSLPKSHKKVIS